MVDAITAKTNQKLIKLISHWIHPWESSFFVDPKWIENIIILC